MDIGWLEDFLALAELRNFTRAAEFRNVSQAAFSRRIQSLENWLGTGLIVKGSQPVRLTEAGEQFRETAQVSVERLLETRASIRGSQFDAMSQIRLAMPNVLARSEFKRILGVIGPRTKTSFSVIVGTTSEVTARYLAGDADILFAHDAPALPTHEALSSHERLALRRDRFLPYATRDAAARERFGFPGTPGQPFPLIAYSQRAYFARLFEHVLERAPHRPSYKVTVQCDMSDVLKEVIVAGYGVGWLPQSTVDAASAEQIAPVDEKDWAMELDICAFRPRHPLGPKIEAVWEALCASVSQG
ncbi:LysR substrate-binding domain-containing protein [Sinirhodobacter sp. WL0062]|uniref:LysR substrate-binding domain-containing protein n=1 Tax=Rhodobacter flavimaris TaxID=2907145 RepID=A0ABS8YZW2_9RHOB|nr:LysR family transcriptional regulator [Sinirhodobacter sp. WL0062]MCE5974301.1 LysR substrate-binding domain-containing protein [Sinirhodobacter sp. WL0062]